MQCCPKKMDRPIESYRRRGSRASFRSSTRLTVRCRSDLLFLNGLSKLWYVHVGFLSNVSYGFNQQSEQYYSSIYNAGPASSTLVVKRAMLILTGWSGCFGESSPTWLLYPLFMDFTFNFVFYIYFPRVTGCNLWRGKDICFRFLCTNQHSANVQIRDSSNPLRKRIVFTCLRRVRGCGIVDKMQKR